MSPYELRSTSQSQVLGFCPTFLNGPPPHLVPLISACIKFLHAVGNVAPEAWSLGSGVLGRVGFPTSWYQHVSPWQKLQASALARQAVWRWLQLWRRPLHPRGSASFLGLCSQKSQGTHSQSYVSMHPCVAPF